jgi:hypothetical protein
MFSFAISVSRPFAPIVAATAIVQQTRLSRCSGRPTQARDLTI